MADKSNSVRPLDFAHFIGQKNVVKTLEVVIASSRKRDAGIDHILLCGPPGLGKTTLAKIISNESGYTFRPSSGVTIARAGDLAALLTSLADKTVLFIDEIHRLSLPLEELLYPAMEDNYLDLMIGKGQGASSVRIHLKRFTLIGATTRSGLLSRPLRDRFGLTLHLSLYDAKAIEEILLWAADNLSIVLSSAAAVEIANRCRGTPRVALRLLKRIRDFAVIDGVDRIDKELANKGLNSLEVDNRGLDKMDRLYLNLLANNYGGGPVGLDTLAAALCEEKDVVEEVIEPFLLQNGMIVRTKQGRMLADKGWQHLGIYDNKGLQKKLLLDD